MQTVQKVREQLVNTIRPTLMRGAAWIVGLGLCHGVWAMSEVGPEQIPPALSAIRSSSGVALILRGEDRVGQRVVPFSINTYFLPPTEREPARAEVWIYRANRLDRQWIADGERLTRWDSASNQYSQAPYKDLTTLLLSLSALSGGPSAVPVRFLRDVYGADEWRPWFRNAKVDAQELDVIFRLGDPLTDRLTYRFLEPFDPNAPRLMSMSGAEIRGEMRTTWTMQIISDFSPQAVRFQFVPQAGSVPVSAPGSVATPR